MFEKIKDMVAFALEASSRLSSLEEGVRNLAKAVEVIGEESQKMSEDKTFNVRQYVEKRMAEGEIELSDKQVRRCISDRQIKEAAEEVMQDIDFSDSIQEALERLAGNGQLDDCFENSGFIKALYENEEFMQRLAHALCDIAAERRR